MKNQFLVYCSLLIPQLISAQISSPDTIKAGRLKSIIRVDGILDESDWGIAQGIGNFTQRELNEGKPASEETRVAVLYNQYTLYIGLWAYDSQPDRIVATEMKRDFFWESDDNFKVIISPFDDKRNGYLFIINPNGAYADILITDEGEGFNQDWNGVWNIKAEVTVEGWFAEIEIPFSTFKFPDREDQIWGINMERNIRRKNEQVLWQGWSRDHVLEQLSQAGKLVGLNNIAGKIQWEIKPFITGGFEKQEDESIKNSFLPLKDSSCTS